MTYQSFIKAHLKNAGLSQRKASQRCGINTIALCRMLKDDYPYKPNRETVEKLVHGLLLNKQDSDELHRLCGHVPRDIEERYCLNDSVAALFRVFAEKNDDDIQMLFRFYLSAS